MKRVREDGLEFDDDRARIDRDLVYRWISQESYWSKGIPRETFERALAGSRPFGVFGSAGAQIAFARVTTDGATIGYVGDVFVDPAHRGMGLSKFLMGEIFAHPGLQGFRRWMLVTSDAHGLYRQFGFDALAHPERMMEKVHPDPYGQGPRA
ncbi:MAG: GNAT family N-acetyltransferase [Tagaea sp.]|nr:GNAT family N-acetyltransferase [Tagaea sp.]